MADLEARPAIGGGGRLPRGSLIRIALAALALMLVFGLARAIIPRLAAGSYASAPASPAVAPGLLVGAAPADSDLQQMAAAARVDGDINLGSPSVAEQAAAVGLGLSYLFLPIPAGQAPTAAQLAAAVRFLRAHTGRGGAVYLHDDVAGGRAVAAAAMLLLLRGDTWPAASARLTPARLSLLSGGQRAAIGELSRALAPGRGTRSGPYAPDRYIRW